MAEKKYTFFRQEVFKFHQEKGFFLKSLVNEWVATVVVLVSILLLLGAMGPFILDRRIRLQGKVVSSGLTCDVVAPYAGIVQVHLHPQERVLPGDLLFSIQPNTARNEQDAADLVSLRAMNLETGPASWASLQTGSTPEAPPQKPLRPQAYAPKERASLGLEKPGLLRCPLIPHPVSVAGYPQAGAHESPAWREKKVQAGHIYSPIGGKVDRIDISSGSFVYAGQAIVGLASAEPPEYRALFYAAPSLVGRLHEGHHVELRYEGFPPEQFGIYQGVVEKVSALSSPSRTGQASCEHKDPLFTVLVNLSSQTLSCSQHTYPLRAGMKVRIALLDEKKSILDSLSEFFSVLLKLAYV